MSTAMADVQRCVISARIIGVMQRAAPKVKMFMISVKWSDHREVTVYRLFQDFEKFHRQLKRLAASRPTAGFKRMIPKFKTRAMRSSMQRKGSSRSVSRMRFLSSYCSELLRCDATVTQSSELTQFFTAREHDLEPDYTKNSIMVLLSEDRSEVTDGAAGVQQRGSVTYPFVTQTYHCVEDFETMDTMNRPFKVTKNQKLDVLIKDPTGWWLVEHEDKRLAWFPAPFLEKCEDDEDDEDEVLNGDRWIRKDSLDDQNNDQTGMFCAIRNYSPKEQDELSLTIGSVVERLKKTDNGWWLVRYKGKEGYVPSLCLEPYHQQRSRLYSLIGKLPNSSTLNMAANGLRNASRRGSFFSASLPEEPNSPDVSVQRVHESDKTKRLHSGLSLDGFKRSVSTAYEFSSVSNVSIPDSCKSPISTLSRFSSYSSMSSVESGISAYKPRSSQWQGMKDHPGHASLSQTGTSDGGHASPDLRLAQGQHQDHPPGHTSSSRSRMSDGERSSPDVNPTYDLRLSMGQHQDHPGHTSSSRTRTSNGGHTSPDLSPTNHLRLSPGQRKDHPGHASSSPSRMSDGERSSPDVSPTYDLRLSQGQRKDHPEHASSSQPRMSDGERSSPDVSPTYDLRLSQGQCKDHPEHASSSQPRMSDGERSSPDVSPTHDLRLSQGQCKDHPEHASSSQPRMSDGERSSPDVSPTYDLRLSQGQRKDHPEHASSSQPRMSDGERSGPDLSFTDLPQPDTGSDSSGSDGSKGSKTVLVAPQVPPKVVFVVASSVHVLNRQISAP